MNFDKILSNFQNFQFSNFEIFVIFYNLKKVPAGSLSQKVKKVQNGIFQFFNFGPKFWSGASKILN